MSQQQLPYMLSALKSANTNHRHITYMRFTQPGITSPSHRISEVFLPPSLLLLLTPTVPLIFSIVASNPIYRSCLALGLGERLDVPFVLSSALPTLSVGPTTQRFAVKEVELQISGWCVLRSGRCEVGWAYVLTIACGVVSVVLSGMPNLRQSLLRRNALLSPLARLPPSDAKCFLLPPSHFQPHIAPPWYTIHKLVFLSGGGGAGGINCNARRRPRSLVVTGDSRIMCHLAHRLSCSAFSSIREQHQAELLATTASVSSFIHLQASLRRCRLLVTLNPTHSTLRSLPPAFSRWYGSQSSAPSSTYLLRVLPLSGVPLISLSADQPHPTP
ncbi:unnamed protein product [Hydatigera taeniaeformis]|uniref:Uncharacterized protein n=1 Tax=Hydatigena taeniaeformis TaxID=6205 RepID=A0A0R3XBI2_HYDTA|nr:unnamed protein product [Hydatigera taeniaeformis]